MKFASTLLRAAAVVFATVSFATGVQAADPKPASLRVLYVGVDPANTELSNIEKASSNADRVLKLRQARAGDFERFLRHYFSTVKVVYGPAYEESMSNDYDVTIFDATPPVIQKEVFEKDPATGRTTNYKPAQYLSKEFDRAAILISDVSPRIGEGLSYKMDWLCQCLDAHAHDMNLSHPIFNAPYKVKPTLEERPMPQNYKVYYSGRALPDTLLMWRTQKEGYMDGKGFPPGLVSTGSGFVDAKDAEVISSGVCQKERDSVALARHGNFFHWGFSADPEYMTDEARLTFVNTVHYIAKFKGQHPYSRRPYRSPSREVALDIAYMQSHNTYEDWVKMQQQSHESRKNYLRQMQQVGQKLSAEDLKAIDEPLPALPNREKWMKEEALSRQPDSVVAKLGTDLSQYLPYYEQNLEYLKPGPRQYTFEVDEDVRSLAVSNRSVGTLDLCVAMLESNIEPGKASRILTRYTGEKFQSPADWRKWLEAHRAKLYFSDVDGFRFHTAT